MNDSSHSPAVKIQRLGHILIAVRDLEKAKDFYTRILGFHVLEQDPEHGGLFLSIGEYGNTLDIFPCANPDADAGDRAEIGRMSGLGVRHTAFAVATEADLREAHKALIREGVKIHKALDHESQKSVYFHDPDGNLLELVWERPDARAIFAKGRSDNDTPLDLNN